MIFVLLSLSFLFIAFRDFDVAAVLVGIILVFIVCHSFKFFVNCYEAYIMHFGKREDKKIARDIYSNIYMVKKARNFN